MKKLNTHYFILSLIFLMVFSLSCSEDDTIGNRGPEDSFLGKNEKIAFEDRDDFIYRFLNNTTNPFEQFNIVNEPVQCFMNYRNFTEAPFWYENYELIENSANTLKIRYRDIQDGINAVDVTMEFTIISAGKINLRWNESEAAEDNWILNRTGLAYTDYEHDCN
ncbi:MAG: hypothetical protein HKO81_00390 [Flavobacteriaceae bacterium]|nr:hypothetical protein [Bacteroidia bacterium]NNL15082.1 hypothetical protein [Flavobacteriaceae bacterium]